MSKFGDSMRPYALRKCSTIDQQLAFLHTEWEAASPEERDQFEQYVAALAKPEQPGNLGRAFLPPLRIELSFECCDDEGNLIDGDEANLAPKVILAAIADWRLGLEYAPKIGLGFNCY